MSHYYGEDHKRQKIGNCEENTSDRDKNYKG